ASFRCGTSGSGSLPTSRLEPRRYCHNAISTNGAERYLGGDPASRTRTPAAVKVPSGAFQDIYDAWTGELACDPGKVRAPVAIIRGEWDGMCCDADARRLFDGLSASPLRRDIKIGRATHLMHLEENRFALYREAETFLLKDDREA